jgi:glycosyltransferase involved in cell wall biosynthesis
MKKKIIVRGPALSRSGYGEHARFVLRALKEKEDLFDIYILNTTWGNTGWLYEDSAERKWIDANILKTSFYLQQSNEFDASIQVTIPNEWHRMAPINIGVTAGIETTRVAPQWVEKSQEVNKIITISEHSKNTYLNTSYEAKNEKTGEVIKDFRCRVPIDIVHYPVKKFAKADIDLDFETDFNFLTVAQWGPRKNLDNTIKWFIEEFIDVPVGLVVKVSIVNNSIIDRYECEKKLKSLLSKYPNRQCKIYLLHGDMSDEEMTSLYSHSKIKAIISLAHGEGFGLPLFEAAYNGLPVLAPDWSGHLDFLYKPTSEGGNSKKKAHFAKVDYDLSPIQKEVIWDQVLIKESMWCFPKQGSYKMKLREMYKDHGRFKKQAKELQAWILENFTEQQQYKKFIDIIMSTVETTSDDEVNLLFDQLMAQ